MNREQISLDCKALYSDSKRNKVFRVIRFTLSYNSDKEDKARIDGWLRDAQNMAEAVNPGAANHSSFKRDFQRILNNCLGGVISENLWKEYFNSKELLVKSPAYDSPTAQIDLEVIKNKKKIEVRSSFPRNGIDFAICNGGFEFDVIGPYSNGYKPGEVQKDLYVRALFHLKKLRDWKNPQGAVIPIIEKLIDKVKADGFEVYLTGGATWDMMVDSKTAIEKSFIPEDEKKIERLSTKTSYRVIPFSRALDTIEIYELVKNGA